VKPRKNAIPPLRQREKENHGAMIYKTNPRCKIKFFQGEEKN
jgi:hypothetical protein